MNFQPIILPLHPVQFLLKISGNPHLMPRITFHFHLLTTDLSILLIRGLSRIFQPKTPLHLPTRIHPKKSQETSMSFPSSYRPRKLMSCSPSHTPFSKLYTNTSPSTHPSYHPYKYPTITTSTRPTPTPYHTWAIPGRLGRPNGSHCTLIQGWIPLPGLVPDVVVYSVMLKV